MEKTVYFVKWDAYGQNGSDIDEWTVKVDGKMSEEALKRWLEKCAHERGGSVYFDYECALYATQN